MDSPISVVGVRNPSALGMALENDAVQVEGKRCGFSADRFADVSGLADGRHSSVRRGNCAGGEDQKQHIEIARDIAQRFNSTYGVAFVLPEPKIGTHGSRIMGLDEPTVKMSKSRALVNRGHSIGIVDAPDAISQAIRRAVTDSGTSIDVQDAGAGIRNLLNIYKSFSGESDQEVSARFDGKGYGVLKNDLSELLVEVHSRQCEANTNNFSQSAPT